MNIITIDPSLNCTALIINNNKFVFANVDLMYTKNESLTKWFSMCNPFITYKAITYDNESSYTKNEIYKLATYEQVANDIHDVIMVNIDPKLDIKVYMEGYSYNSAAGKLIDLVTFSTLLRRKLYEVTEHIEIIPPATLKVETAKFTYPPIITGKKVIKYQYKNNEGVSGGVFKKPDMFKAIIENNMLNCEWSQFLRHNKDEILKLTNIPKPIEDMNDAFLMYNIILKNG